MVHTRLTTVGKIFLTLMVLLYGASVTSQSGLLLLLIGIIAGCFVVNWSFARRNVRNLVVEAPKEACLVEGGKLDQPWRLGNPSGKHFEQVEIFSGDRLICAVPLVKVAETVSIIPKAIYARRGVFPNAEVTIRSSAPYGLLRAERKLALDGEVIVFPKLYETLSPAGTGLELLAGGKFRGSRQVNNGTHFAGVRAWQSGDSIKQVDWKTTARREQLMVRSFEEELGGRVSILLDAAPSDIKHVDNAVRAAGSLAAAALQEGHHLEFLDFADEGRLRLPPFSDERELLERLARYNPLPVAPALPFDSLSRKVTIALVGTEWRASWSAFIKEAVHQNRSVHVYLPAGAELPHSDSDTGATIWQVHADEITGSSFQSEKRR